MRDIEAQIVKSKLKISTVVDFSGVVNNSRQKQIKNFYCCRFLQEDARSVVKSKLKISTVVDLVNLIVTFCVKSKLKISTVVDPTPLTRICVSKAN